MGKYMYNYNNYYAHSSKKRGGQVVVDLNAAITVLPGATATVADASSNHLWRNLWTQNLENKSDNKKTYIFFFLC